MARILVADDDPLIRALLTECLERGGYDVTAAHDGSEAIRLLVDNHGFDVVVTDYEMPRADGIAVIAAARTVDPNLPCIIVTAYHDLDVAMRAMAAGAVNFIPKPFKPVHLLTIVERAMERRLIAAEAVRLRILAPMLERFTMVLANTLEAKDLATNDHCQRLVHIADAIAIELDIDPVRRSHLRMGACLHDIGKVAIPDHLLSKAGKLTSEEFAVLQRHPDIGADILSEVDTWSEVRDIVRHHHEHFNGMGYPSRLHGDAIPLGARIVAVADAFDVMRSGRPYSPPRSLEWIVGELHEHRGTQFDPDCVDAFLAALERGAVNADPAAHAHTDEGRTALPDTAWLLPHHSDTASGTNILSA